MYKKTELPNGLRVVSCEMKDRDSLALGFWIGVGGRYEEPHHKGAAHFLEHMLFKGSRSYTCEQIKVNIEGVGGALNAFTSEEQTCYYAKIPAKFLKSTFTIFADMIAYPNIATPDVEKERTVIIEEIKMYQDLPQYHVQELLDSLVWPNHPLGQGLTGTIESVSQMATKDLRHFHSRYYAPGNIVVAVCGRVRHEEVVKLALSKLGKISHPGACTYQKVTESQNKAQLKVFKKNTEQMHLALGFPGYDENNDDRYALSLLSIILGGNMSSRLFVEIREKKGLAYSIACSSKSMHDTGMFLVRAGVDNKKLIDAIKLILQQLEKVKSQGVTAGEFTRAKDYLLGQLQLGLEDTMEHMLWVGESVISKNKTKTLQDLMQSFTKIKKDDLKRVGRDVLRKSRTNLAVVGFVDDKQDRKMKRLLGI